MRAEFALEQMDEVCVAGAVHQWSVGKSSGFAWQLRFVLMPDGFDDAKLPWVAFALHEFDYTFS